MCENIVEPERPQVRI